MNKTLIFSNKTFYWLIALFACLLLATGYHRTEMYDDAWFAEQSYLLLKDGKIHSEFFRGLLGWENHIYTAHKGFVLLGACIMGFTDISLLGSKSISLLALLVLIYAFWKYYVLLNISFWQSNKTLLFSLAVLFLLANGKILEYALVNRPELLMATLGFYSFYFLLKNDRFSVVWAGVLAGFSLLIHLNGVIYLMAGGLFLLLSKQSNKLFIFGMVAFGISLLYFADVVYTNQISTWWYQFTHDPATTEAWNWHSKVLVMLNVPRMFFLSDQEAMLSTMALVVFVVFFRNGLSNQPIQTYFICLFLSYMLVTKNNAPHYYILFIPFLIVWIVDWICLGLPLASYTNKLIIKITFLLYLLIGLNNVVKLIHQNLSQRYLPDHNLLLASKIPERSRIVAPLSFFYNQYPAYYIRAHYYYYLLGRDKYHNKMSAETFFKLAHQQKQEYIIFDYLQDDFTYFPKRNKTQVETFRRIFQDERFSIFKNDFGKGGNSLTRPDMYRQGRRLSCNFVLFVGESTNK